MGEAPVRAHRGARGPAPPRHAARSATAPPRAPPPVRAPPPPPARVCSARAVRSAPPQRCAQPPPSPPRAQLPARVAPRCARGPSRARAPPSPPPTRPRKSAHHLRHRAAHSPVRDFPATAAPLGESASRDRYAAPFDLGARDLSAARAPPRLSPPRAAAPSPDDPEEPHARPRRPAQCGAARIVPSPDPLLRLSRPPAWSRYSSALSARKLLLRKRGAPCKTERAVDPRFLGARCAVDAQTHGVLTTDNGWCN